MKIIKKEKSINGKRKIYLFGKKVFSYKKAKALKEECKSSILIEDNLHEEIKDNNEYYRSLGVKIGKGTQFVIYPHDDDHPNFGSEPFLVEIGDDCLISFGVTFLTHDGSRKICLKYIDEAKRDNIITWEKIKIGNNVFVGCHSIIMPGVNIGNDVVVGAGSIVTKDIPDGQVWAGNPAKFIKMTRDLANKMVQFNESDEIKNMKIHYADKLEQIKKIGD